MYLQQGELYMSFPADLTWENSNQLLTVLRTQLLIFFNNIFPCLIWITILLIDISCIFTTSFQVLKKPDLNLSCFRCLLCNKLKSIADYWEPRWNFIITPVCKYCPLTSVFITILQTPRPIFTGKISCTPLNTNLIATLYQIQLRIYIQIWFQTLQALVYRDSIQSNTSTSDNLIPSKLKHQWTAFSPI